MKANNPFLMSSLLPLIQNFMVRTLIFLHALRVFIPKRLWFLRRFNWQNVFPRRPPYQNSLNNGEKVSCGPLGETDFRFRLKLKYNFSGIDVSQSTPSMSLSSPHFLLFYRKHTYYYKKFCSHGNSFPVLTYLISIWKWFSAAKMLSKATNLR